MLVVLHGWMDSSASFQFLADELAPRWRVVGLDWRGFGLTGAVGTDCYEFGDYLGDLDAFLRHLSPNAPVSLVGHSMGGNAAMLYAGVRPERVRHMVNLEGLGMRGHQADEVPQRLAIWLDQIAASASRQSTYDSLDAVALRLRKTNPRLHPDQAAFLATHFAQNTGKHWQLMADPAHKIINRTAYRVDETLACWRQIAAPVLWLEGADSQIRRDMYAVPGYAERLAAVPSLSLSVVADAGHMLHHDQPKVVAQLVADFLAGGSP